MRHHQVNERTRGGTFRKPLTNLHTGLPLRQYFRGETAFAKAGMEDSVRSTFFTAQSLNFRGDIDDWRKLLAIFPR